MRNVIIDFLAVHVEIWMCVYVMRIFKITRLTIGTKESCLLQNKLCETVGKISSLTWSMRTFDM